MKTGVKVRGRGEEEITTICKTLMTEAISELTEIPLVRLNRINDLKWAADWGLYLQWDR